MYYHVHFLSFFLPFNLLSSFLLSSSLLSLIESLLMLFKHSFISFIVFSLLNFYFQFYFIKVCFLFYCIFSWWFSFAHYLRQTPYFFCNSHIQQYQFSFYLCLCSVLSTLIKTTSNNWFHLLQTFWHFIVEI